jgi:hypothetical protein
MSELPALMFGRPGFFTPRTLLDWFSFGNLVSYYDELLPPDLASTEQAKRLHEHGCVAEMDIVQLSTAQPSPRVHRKITISIVLQCSRGRPPWKLF